MCLLFDHIHKVIILIFTYYLLKSTVNNRDTTKVESINFFSITFSKSTFNKHL